MALRPYAETSATCRACREPIRPGAAKCVKCGSDQGWTRFLGFSSTIVALLIALISVLQTALPTFIQLYKGDRSEVSVTFLKAEGDTLIFAVSNSGNMPGTISSSDIELDNEVMPFPLDRGSDADLIAAGSMQKVAFGLSPTIEKFLSARGPFAAKPARVHVVAKQYDGSSSASTWEISVSCLGAKCWLTDPIP